MTSPQEDAAWAVMTEAAAIINLADEIAEAGRMVPLYVVETLTELWVRLDYDFSAWQARQSTDTPRSHR